MAQLTLTKLQCIRKQDISGKDEPVLYIAGQEVWEGKLSKGSSSRFNLSHRFDNTVFVELKERDAKKDKLLKSWTISEDNSNGTQDLTASSSGYHYVLSYDVA